MEEPRLFKDILSEAIEKSGLSLEKLGSVTGVPERFILAFLENNYNNLPSVPYARGYLKKIAEAADIDMEELWRAYERESKPLRSGVNDALPGNRFTMKPFNKKIIGGALIGLLIVLYIGFNAKQLIGTPDLAIESPIDETTRVEQNLALIRGRVTDPKDVVTVNGAFIDVDQSGEFSREFLLDPGVNIFQITAQRFLGRSKTETRQIIYETINNNEQKSPIKN